MNSNGKKLIFFTVHRILCIDVNYFVLNKQNMKTGYERTIFENHVELSDTHFDESKL